MTAGGGAPPLLRAIVVDDEPLARRGVIARLAREPDVRVVAECATGRDAVATIRRERPDVVFLDVQMPGLDGFGVIAELDAGELPLVVFLTAYDEHALRAFAAHATDYLLKPIDDARFREALAHVRRRAAERRAAAGGAEDEARLAEVLVARFGPEASSSEPRLAFRDRGRVELLPLHRLDWVEAEGDYVRLHVGARSHLVRSTMAAMAQRLPTPPFVRIHRSTIVNVARIARLVPHANAEWMVHLADGTTLKLSRGYRERVEELLAGAL